MDRKRKRRSGKSFKFHQMDLTNLLSDSVMLMWSHQVLKREFDKVRKSIKETPCPVCQKKLDEQQSEERKTRRQRAT